MKATLLFLILFFLVSCERTSNVSESRRVGTTIGAYINEYTIDGHDYIEKGYGMAHSGTCRKCKQESDSIVNVIINTIENGRNNN